MQRVLSVYSSDDLHGFKAVLEAYLEAATHPGLSPYLDTLIAASETERNRLLKLPSYKGVGELYEQYLVAIEEVVEKVCRKVWLSQVELDDITVFENRDFRIAHVWLMKRGHQRFETMVWSILGRVGVEIRRWEMDQGDSVVWEEA